MTHRFRFFRVGGFDQVRLESGADLLALKELDQKLWVALACPTRGVEFDARTLALLDTDNDGYIRPPELLAAIDWAATRLADIEVLARGLEGVPLNAIRDDESTAALREAASIACAGQPAGQALLTVYAASAAEAEQQARTQAEWEAAGRDSQPLGDATEAACSAMLAVKSKVDDFFLRCRMVRFDARTIEALNPSDDSLRAASSTEISLQTSALADLPLARVDGQAQLPLTGGINPAWAGRIEALVTQAVTPLLGTRDVLTEADWVALQGKLQPYLDWQAGKPGTTLADAEAGGVRDLERLARYVRDLLPFANQMVAFRDFYSRRGKAVFQIGTLYLDGRAADLCVAVNDAGRHAALASLSRLYLAYCDCMRGTEKLSVAAAFTAGDVDQLMVGRNGVFYDRQGRDWQATITKIIDHPISLRQAFWSPWRRLQRLIGEQMQKFAASKASAADSQLASAAAQPGKALTPVAKSAVPFDVGKFAGIFAAIGLAVGALGTALASVLTGVLGLKWWQMPLALAGLLLLVSGPAMAMAWFKLRARTLGPLLDANGWAVNARALINIPFGTTLTQLARLPEGSERSLSDPYAEKEAPWKTYLFIGAVIFVAAAWLSH